MATKKELIHSRLIGIILLIGLLKLFDFNQTMSAMWIGPYLSAALNFDFSNFQLLVNMDEVKHFATLSKDEIFKYHFMHQDNLVSYDYLAKGFVVILIIAKKIFFWTGDLEALQYLQYIIHIVLSLIIYSLFTKRYQKILFILFYTLNPLVLYFVNFPFYYFWQVIPSVIFIYWYLKRNVDLKMLLFFSVVFAFIYITRPTVLFLILLFYILFAIYSSKKYAFIGFVTFIVLINITPKLNIGPWHTMYIGIGGYKNDYNITLSDNAGYEYYQKTTGKVANSTNMYKHEVKKDYYKVIKQRYFEILKENPMLLIKNTILNILESYSFGYKTNNLKITYISAFIGLILMLLLLYTKQYIIFLAIGFAGGSFTPYYPPIPAYMFGNYILIVLGIIGIVDYFRKNLKKEIKCVE